MLVMLVVCVLLLCGIKVGLIMVVLLFGEVFVFGIEVGCMMVVFWLFGVLVG